MALRNALRHPHHKNRSALPAEGRLTVLIARRQADSVSAAAVVVAAAVVIAAATAVAAAHEEQKDQDNEPEVVAVISAHNQHSLSECRIVGASRPDRGALFGEAVDSAS